MTFKIWINDILIVIAGFAVLMLRVYSCNYAQGSLQVGIIWDAREWKLDWLPARKASETLY